MEPERSNAPHCLILPYPNQGHINPLLQFSKRLLHRNLRITLALTKFTLKSVHGHFSDDQSILVRAISDGFDDGGRRQANSFEDYHARFGQVGRETLADLVQDLAASGQPVDCVVYDPFLPWALDVAKESGLLAAAFFTQSYAVNRVYDAVQCGRLKLPLPLGDELVVIPGLPPLRPEEMPSFIYAHGSYPEVFKMVTDQFSNLGRADWIFINTFYKLEEEIINSVPRFREMKPIGPTLPSMYLDKRLQEDEDYNLSFFEPTTIDCIHWLNQRPPKSVIYISFGSLAQLNVDQTQQLAFALTASDRHFLWAVRSSEKAKLPEHFSPEKGLIVPWCPQLQVLAHDALGCFITHCGWNSTLEGLCLGVPIVAMPQWTDQSTNAKFIADIWEVGMWARRDGEGLVRKDEIVRCIKCVMEEHEGEKIRRNARKWKETAREAVDEGGSSDRNIEEFVSSLANKF